MDVMIEIVWGKIPCRLMKSYLRFEWVSCLNIYGLSQCLLTRVPRNPVIWQNFVRFSETNRQINTQKILTFKIPRKISSILQKRGKMRDFFTNKFPYMYSCL
jgi:hypothetical protein